MISGIVGTKIIKPKYKKIEPVEEVDRHDVLDHETIIIDVDFEDIEAEEKEDNFALLEELDELVLYNKRGKTRTIKKNHNFDKTV